ncbi:hypothetical protein ACFWDA_25035, partial [Rhodococcus zopfii]
MSSSYCAFSPAVETPVVRSGTDEEARPIRFGAGVKSLDVVYGPLRDSSSVSQAVKAGATSSVSL